MTPLRVGLGLLALLVLSAVASGQYYDGYRQGGFIHRGGYWYDSANTPHTLTYRTSPGYYQGGCYYASTTYPVYTVYYPPVAAAPYVAPVAALPTYTDAGWRGKLLDFAAAKDKAEAAIRAGAIEHAAYMDALRFMGLEGSLRALPPVGLPFVPGLQMPGSPGYSLSGHYYSYPVSGNTQYGYQSQTYNSQTQGYKDADMMQLFQMMNQHVQAAGTIFDTGSGQFKQLVGQVGQNQARVAELFAKAEIMKSMFQVLQSPGEVKGYQFKITPMGYIERDASKVAPQDVTALRQAWGEGAAKDCGGCHSGANAKGGFELNSYLTMSQKEKQDRVWSRIFSTDPAKMMPRAEGGGPGTPLSDAKKQQWLLN